MYKLGILAVLFLGGCSAYPSQAYYHGNHVAPNQVGYVSTPYYSYGRTKGYVSSYPSESIEVPTGAPYPQFYVSANQPQAQAPNAFGMGLGLTAQRVEAGVTYYVFQHPQMQAALMRALDNVPAAQTVQVGATREGAPILFTANSNVYQAARTQEWCREGFLEAANQGVIRGTFCKNNQSPWGLIK